MRRTSSVSMPSTLPAAKMSSSVRSAALGIVGTSLRLTISTSTSAFMPGFSSRSRFSMSMSTGNMVTFCSATACGSTLMTTPRNGRFGKAATFTVAPSPGRILPMSISSTNIRTCTCERSAIFISSVPPPTSPMGEEMTCPCSTSRSMTVPVMGETTSESSSWMTAFSTWISPRTTSDLAVACSKVDCSQSALESDSRS